MSAYLRQSRKGGGIPSGPVGSPALRGVPARFDAGDRMRRLMIGKIHLAQKALALTEQDYRDQLEELTGLRSCKDMSDSQLRQVLDWARTKGFEHKPAAAKSARKARNRAADHPSARKARALWISLYHLNAIDDRRESALEAFARRQLGCDALQWADQSQIYKLVEALKSMAVRHGWDQSTAGTESPGDAIRRLKLNLLKAIAQRLRDCGVAEARWTLPVIVERVTGYQGAGSAAHWPETDLDTLARLLGDQLRATLKEMTHAG